MRRIGIILSAVGGMAFIFSLFAAPHASKDDVSFKIFFIGAILAVVIGVTLIVSAPGDKKDE